MQTSLNQNPLVVDLFQCQLLSLVGLLPEEQILMSSYGEIVYSNNKSNAAIALSAKSHSRFFLFSSSSSSFELASDWREICTKSTFGDAAMVQPAYRKIAPSGADPLATLICEPCARTCTTGFQPVNPLEWTANKALTSRFISDVTIVSGDVDVAAPSGYTKLPVELNYSGSGNYAYLCIKRGGPRALTQLFVHIEEVGDTKSSEGSLNDLDKVMPLDHDNDYGSPATVGANVYIGYNTVQAAGNMEKLTTLAITDIAVIVSEQVAPASAYIKITRNLNEGAIGSDPVYLSYRLSPLGGFVCNTSQEHSEFGECLFATRHATEVNSVLDVMERGLNPPQNTLAAARMRVDATFMSDHYRQHQPSMIQRLQSGVQRAQSYESKHMQEAALKRIPVKELEERARAHPTLMSSYQDELVKQLLHWFKREFFTWMNQPRCSACNHEKTRSVRMEGPSTSEEIAGQASRVEVYMCPACGSLTRFPRYNDPVKLLETRTGRCGEWANCFTLCCRAMGFEARYVLDVTDHVWTEVYSEHHKRWLHCDSCEDQLDSPLTYEVGWGKKLSYIFSFGHDEVVDTARRYTQNWAEMRTRRQDVSEAWLQTTISQMNSELRKRQTSERVAILTARAESERRELLCGRSIQKSEIKGRISGSAEWKSQRNEDGKEAGEFTKVATSSNSSMTKKANEAADLLQEVCRTWVLGCQSLACYSPFCFTGRTRSRFVTTPSDVNERAAQAIQVMNDLSSNGFPSESLVPLRCSNRSIELRNFVWRHGPLLYLPLQDPPSKDGRVPLIDVSGYNNHVHNLQHCALRKPYQIPFSGQDVDLDTKAGCHSEDRAFGMQLLGSKRLEIADLSLPRASSFILSFLVRFDHNEGLSVPQSVSRSILYVRMGAAKATSLVEFRVSWDSAGNDFLCEVTVDESRSKSSACAASLLSFGQYTHIGIACDKGNVVIYINGNETLWLEGELQGEKHDVHLQGPDSGSLAIATVISHVAVIPLPSSETAKGFCADMKTYFVSAPPLKAFGSDGKRSEERCAEVAAKAQSGYRVSRVMMWGHEYLDGIQFVYEKSLTSNETTASSEQSTLLYGALVGNENAHRQASQPTVILELVQDEVVTRVSGRKGAWIDSMTLCTNLGRSISCGGKGGGDFAVPTPAHTEIRAISFKVGNHLTDLCAFVLECPLIKDTEDKAMQELSRLFSSSESSLRPTAIAAAMRYLENIVRQPKELKFQRIRASNKFFAKSVGALGDETAKAFMLWCGFEETWDQSEKYFRFQAHGKVARQLEAEAHKRLYFLEKCQDAVKHV